VPTKIVTPPWPLFTAIVLTLATTLLIGLVAAPNSTEGLIYHLARVDMWIQHGSIEPYATSTTRQIFMPVWTELATLHDEVRPCERCGNIADVVAGEPTVVCAICKDHKRDSKVLCVVGRVHDLMAIERTGAMRGRYFVLG
jgi:hypothetical protein